MKLSELQQSFQNYILADHPAIAASITAPERGNSDERLQVYGNGYGERLIEVLANDFSKLFSILGEDKFHEITARYVDERPSQHFSIDYFGKDFSDFLKKTAPYNEKPWVAEIAEFEWMQGMALIAADAEILTSADLSAVAAEDWPNLTFALHPSLQVITQHWNTLSLIEKIDENDTTFAALDTAAELLEQPIQVIIWRKDIIIQYCELSAAQTNMLQAIKQNQTFAEICDGLCEDMPEEEAANFAAQQLAGWLQTKLLTSV